MYYKDALMLEGSGEGWVGTKEKPDKCWCEELVYGGST
jgi:hypothetical protein